MFDLDALAALARVLGVEQDVAAGSGAVFQSNKLVLVGYGAADFPRCTAISVRVAQVKNDPRISASHCCYSLDAKVADLA